MTYTVQQESGYDIVRLTGDIDLSCSPQARKTILTSLSLGHHTLVDLSAVSYIDSSGVASLVEGFQSARKTVTKKLAAAGKTVAKQLKAAKKVVSEVETRPLTMLAIAAGIGFLYGMSKR